MIDVGTWISKAPNRLKASATNRTPIPRFNHGLAARSCTDVAPNNTENTIPMSVKVEMMPIAYREASRTALPRCCSLRLVKKLTVMGIIGNTQGVSKARNPIPIAPKKKPRRPSRFSSSISSEPRAVVSATGVTAAESGSTAATASGAVRSAAVVSAANTVMVNGTSDSSGGRQLVVSQSW